MKTLEELGISPAPWETNGKEVSDSFRGQSFGATVADCYNAANARLIASAPMLYEALRETVAALQNRLPKEPTYDESEIVINAYRALAAAAAQTESEEAK